MRRVILVISLILILASEVFALDYNKTKANMNKAYGNLKQQKTQLETNVKLLNDEMLRLEGQMLLIDSLIKIEKQEKDMNKTVEKEITKESITAHLKNIFAGLSGVEVKDLNLDTLIIKGLEVSEADLLEIKIDLADYYNVDLVNLNLQELTINKLITQIEKEIKKIKE